MTSTAGRARPFSWCAEHVRQLGGGSPLPSLMVAKGASEAQGRRREAGSEGSVEQNRGLMDKNRIGGRPGRTSEPWIAKSTTIKGRGGKSGRRAGKAVELTSGD